MAENYSFNKFYNVDLVNLDMSDNFSCLCSSIRHRKLAEEVYSQLPARVKKIVTNKRIHVSDMFYYSSFPDRKVHKELLGFYMVGTNTINITPKDDGLFSDDALKGTIVHELGHAIINLTFCLSQKLFYRIKYRLSPEHIKQLYASSNAPSEELHTDSLAISWGFRKEIQAHNKERITFIKQ